MLKVRHTLRKRDGTMHIFRGENPEAGLPRLDMRTSGLPYALFIEQTVHKYAVNCIVCKRGRGVDRETCYRVPGHEAVEVCDECKAGGHKAKTPPERRMTFAEAAKVLPKGKTEPKP